MMQSFCSETITYTCVKCNLDIRPRMHYYKDGDGKRFHESCINRTQSGTASSKRSRKMAKAITQDTVDKAVTKAVAAETKRCIKAAKSLEVDKAGKKIIASIVAEINKAPEAAA